MSVLPVDVDGAAHSLTAEVAGIEGGEREQQLGQAIGADAEVFLGPWISPVVTAQARFDMRDGNARQCGAERAANAVDVSPCTTTSAASRMAAPIMRVMSFAWANGSGCPLQPSCVVASAGIP
jgi:hypothetical protein